jgi:phenylpropionate dioxygenase-like ring-hydroxylating dioxygenase large terminal subunit
MTLPSRLHAERLTPDPSHSATLPGAAYLDPEIFELEKRELFYRTWHYAGWVGDLKATGDYITATLLDQSVIIIRSRDGELAGFHNVCQHRAHQLLRGRGRVTTITCPYHAWVYRLDGTLRAARGSKTTGAFDVDAIRLQPVRVEVVAENFVFFNLDMDTQPFGEQITDFIADLRREIPDFDRLVRVDTPAIASDYNPLEGMYPVEANWKVVMENFLECYHCRGTHPKFCADLTVDDLTYEGHRLWAKQKSGTRRAHGGEQIFWTLFPNLTLTFSTGEAPSLSFFVFAVPEGHARTVPGLFQNYRLAGDEDGVSFQPDWGPVGIEDKNLCESVQRGLASIGYDRGRFMYDPDQGELTEEAVHAFNRFVLDALGL